MNSRCVYLDRNFWRDALKDKNLFSDICRVLIRNEIHTNITREEILSDSILFQLFQDGDGRFFYVDEFPNETTIKGEEFITCSMCLSNDRIGKCAERYGFLSFDNNSLSEHKYVFESEPAWIYEEKKYENGWRDIYKGEKGRNPLCNSMIINDKFLCKDGDEEGVNDNVRSLLDALLPEGPQLLTFQLSIFCKIDNRDRGHKVYKGLLKYIELIRPKLNFVLTLYTSSNVHNRFVLTNSYIAEVGAGFNLFKNGKADNGSEMNYYYPLVRGNNEVFIGKLKQVEKVHRDAYQKEHFRNYWGEKKNRLFDLISHE